MNDRKQPAGEGPERRRPNIPVIMADQLAPQFTGACGNAIARTPHLDGLARRGTRFDAAYCNSPLCAPSRASFMTGRHVSSIRTWDNAAEFAASIPTFAIISALPATAPAWPARCTSQAPTRSTASSTA